MDGSRGAREGLSAAFPPPTPTREKLMKHLFQLVFKTVVVTLVVILTYVATTWLPRSDPLKSQTHSVGLTIDQVRQLAQLVTLRVPVSDVQSAKLSGYTGTVRLVLLVHGHVDLGTDLDQAHFAKIDSKHHQATLVLPQPAVLSVVVDVDRTSIYTVDWTGLWHVLPGGGAERKLINQAMAKAKQDVGKAGDVKANLLQARQHAEAVIRRFCERLGWRVTIRFKRE